MIPAFRYRNAPAAIDWLCKVFGFERHAVYENEDGTIAHAELALNGGMIMLGSQKDDEQSRASNRRKSWAARKRRSLHRGPDADAVHARAVAAGAQLSARSRTLTMAAASSA